jgi:preprotein translocase subunit YajC
MTDIIPGTPTVETETQATTTEVQAPAPADAAANGGFFSKEALMNFMPIILIFAVFYFFIIRPQMKKQREQQALVQSAKKGDSVIVAGGIIGKIVREKEGDIIILEVAKGVQIEVLKTSIVSKVDNKKDVANVAKK